MATKLTKIVSNFSTSLAAKVAAAATSATLVNATDDDGVALPAGKYYFTIDGDNNQREHIYCDLSGTALTNIKSVSVQGAQTSGLVREHRAGALVALTDHAIIREIVNLLDGTTDLNAAVPLKYDADPTISDDKHIATKKYVDGVAVSGAPDASTSVKGLVEEATQAEVDAKTAAGGTSAQLFINPATLRATNVNDYVASDTGAADAYAIATNPVITAYAAGQVFIFKATNASTGASTLAVCGLASPKTIKKNHDVDLVAGDIEAGQVVVVVYDGTNMQMVSPIGNSPASLYQLLSNIDTTTTLGTSDTKYPSQKAVKTYVDTEIATTMRTSKNGSVSLNYSTYESVKTFAHGLGVTPKKISVLISGGPTNGQYAMGFWGPSGQASLSFRGTGAAPVMSSSNCGIVYVGNAGDKTITISADATNITVTISPANGDTWTCTVYISWCAEA